jgi:hypothetical protein
VPGALINLVLLPTDSKPVVIKAAIKGIEFTSAVPA